MIHVDRVNENGYRALLGIASDSPQLFTTPNLERLRDEMINRADTEDLWSQQPISLNCSMNSLNDIVERGPGTDYQHAKIIRQALHGLSFVDLTDELFWASINCFALTDYVPIRWSTSNTRNTNPTNFINSHWLKTGSKGRESNASARLWWLGEIAERVARFSQHNTGELLDAMANNVNLYHQTLARPYLLANPRLVAAIYDLALDGNEHLFQTAYANQLFKSLNLRAGATALDMMDDDELRAVVEEAKPPKEM